MFIAFRELHISLLVPGGDVGETSMRGWSIVIKYLFSPFLILSYFNLLITSLKWSL